VGDLPICLFFSQRKDILEDIVKDTELAEFKKQIYDVRYKIENGEINAIIRSLNDIQVGCELKFTYFDQEEAT